MRARMYYLLLDVSKNVILNTLYLILIKNPYPLSLLTHQWGTYT